MELQKDSHIKQQRLIQERWKRESRRGAKASVPGADPAPTAPPQLPAPPHQGQGRQGPGGSEREYDTLLYPLLDRRPPPGPTGTKTAKDDKTRLEEQQTAMEDLRHMLGALMDENQRLSSENARLRAENARLRAEAEAADSADLVERSELWVLPPDKSCSGKGKDIAIPQLPPLEMPAQEDLCLDDLPPLELPEDIQHQLQELLDRDKL